MFLKYFTVRFQTTFIILCQKMKDRRKPSLNYFMKSLMFKENIMYSIYSLYIKSLNTKENNTCWLHSYFNLESK